MGSNPTGPACQPPVPSSIPSYLWELKKRGYRPETIKSHGQILKLLCKRCNLAEPETVRTYLAKATVSLGRKENIANAYSSYAKFTGVAFERPRYQREDRLPKIPQEQWLLDVINCARHVRHATTLRGLFETGCRVGEWCSLTAKDFDFNRKVVRLTAEKGSKSRECRISDTLVVMVTECLAKSPEHPFPNSSAVKKHIWRTTHYLAKVNNNPAYLQIHCHTYRHFVACMTYHMTHDILYVMKFLGHRSISSTMKYLQLVELGGNEAYHVKATSSLEEVVKLLEQGFTYSNSVGDIGLYKKRK